jgi:hypothetical protein
MTALHDASNFGHTETAMALVKAGADVHCKDRAGYGSTGCTLASSFCHRAEADGPFSLSCAARASVRLCSLTALHYASLFGRTETALALVKAGADMHCKDRAGYGRVGLSHVSSVSESVARTVRPVGVELQDYLLVCQEYSTRSSAGRGAHPHSAGVCRDARGLALPGILLVRSRPSSSLIVWSPLRRMSNGPSSRVGATGVSLLLCSNTALLHLASRDGHTETAIALVKAGADVHCKDNGGCGS